MRVDKNGTLTAVTNEDLKRLKNDPKFWEGVTSIGLKAFAKCDDLTEIVIPDFV